jgi:carbon starvation protein CstA
MKRIPLALLLTGCSQPATMTQAALQAFPVLVCVVLFAIGAMLIKDQPWARYFWGALIGLAIIVGLVLYAMSKVIGMEEAG